MKPLSLLPLLSLAGCFAMGSSLDLAHVAGVADSVCACDTATCADTAAARFNPEIDRPRFGEEASFSTQVDRMTACAAALALDSAAIPAP